MSNLRLISDESAGELTPRQVEYVIAICSTSSTTEAARVAGCDRTTILRQMKRPEVAKAIEAHRRQALAVASSRLLSLAETAVSALEGVLTSTDSPAAAKVAAAREVLSRAESMKNEIEVRERLERLEREAARVRGVK